MLHKNLIVAVISSALSTLVLASEKQNEFETVTVIGSVEAARELPGSGSVISSEQWTNEAITDINQALKTVPGIYIREEDGYGLRPNIGIRGATAERSEKITLLEDGVMIAPAPYTAPSAYYFPTAIRMHGVEVLKGAPLLRHGPQTTGGVVNLISTPIPNQQAGTLLFSLNNHNGSNDFLANFGNSFDTESGTWGFMLETAQRHHDGYKDIDRSNQDTGFSIQDYVGKLSWENDRNRVLLKVQHSEEESNETYLGLTDADFDNDANRRYGLSEIDKMENDHTGVNLSHTFKWTENLNQTTTVYHNQFNRDWFKLSGGGSYITAANSGDATAQAILDGTSGTGDVTGLNYKHNNREYESMGLQSNINWLIGAHTLDMGARIHHDDMDRYQPVEIYDQINGELVYQSTTAPTGSNNREEEANALSFWATDNWQFNDRLLLSLALRYEDFETTRTEYSDPSRNTIASKRSNQSDKWLPGISATYDFTDTIQGLAGAHQGLSPLGGGAKENEEPEESDNYELGARFDNGVVFIETIAFYSDFSNKTELCSVGSVCSNGADSGSYSVGGATISGVEFQFGSKTDAGSFTIPVNLAYTYTKAEINENDPDQGISKGEQLKDVPENIASFRTGLEHESGWNNYIIAKYTDELCVSIGCNKNNDIYDRTEDLLTIDIITRYTLSAGPEVFLKFENIFDEQRIVSRNPDGARPNMPLTATAGIRFDF